MSEDLCLEDGEFSHRDCPFCGRCVNCDGCDCDESEESENGGMVWSSREGAAWV